MISMRATNFVEELRTFACRIVVHLCMIIHPSLFRYAISFFAVHASRGRYISALISNPGEVAKLRTIVTSGLEDAHTLSNRCPRKSLVVWGVDGR